ncbi:hypothetical protein N0V90_004308 [Kalmusia sp. IMI 367209]|nr:hypothetical protein N0V90_004308 [Kalmusia sp. IMI 367209]
MSLSYADMVALHQKAVANLDRKLGPIPRQVFFAGRKPTIGDIYQQTNACLIDDIPSFFGLTYVFVNYSKFKANDFRALKVENEFDIAQATWYYRMDKTRSFSCQRTHALINFVVACITIGRPMENLKLFNFLNSYIDAFIDASFRLPAEESNNQAEFLKSWWCSEYDLIRFSSGDLKRIMKKIKTVRQTVRIPEMPFAPADFETAARKVPPAVYREFSFAWAVAFLSGIEKGAEYSDALEKEYAIQEAIRTDDLSNGLISLGMNLEIPAYLRQEHFAQEMVQALLKDDEVVQSGIPVEGSSMWMAPQDAIQLLEGKDISEMLENMKLT